MKLEEMSKEQLIELVKKQEAELGEYVAIPLVEFKDAQPVQQPAPVVEPHYEAGRRQGRAEALATLMTIEPECGIDDYIGWSKSGAPEDEGCAHWRESKLRELFAVDGELADMMDKAEAEYWRYIGLQDEAKHAKNFAANMHGSGKVREVLSKAGEFDLISQLCSAAPVAAPVAGQETVILPFVIEPEAMIAFRRFYDCALDNEGYDVPASMMKHLASIGLVQRGHANYYETTDFGLAVLDGKFAATVPAASVQAEYDFDALDHGDTVLRIQKALGMTDTGWLSPDIVIHYLEKALQPDSGRDAALVDNEKFRMHMATISTASFGYCNVKELAGTEYDTPTLRDVVALYEKYEALFTAAHPADSVAQGEGRQDRIDAERLKWLCEHGAHIAYTMDGETCNVWLPPERDGTEARPAEGWPQKRYGHWREAIDAAIAALNKKGRP